MKKIFVLFCAVFSLIACSDLNSSKQEEVSASSPVIFNVKVSTLDTKAAAKADWADGDVIYVVFKGIDTKYMYLTYQAGTWTATESTVFSVADFSSLSEYALTAVHFPVPVTASMSGGVLGFTANDKPVYTYYLKQATSYTLSGTIVTITLTLTKADGFAQFHVPGITTATIADYAFAANDVTPAACTGIDASTGAITETEKNVGAQFGGFVDADGAVFSAKITKNGTEQDYTFLLTSTTNIYAFTMNRALSAGTFYRFNATDDAMWTTNKAVESMGTVDLGLPSGRLWGNRLMGATSETASGKYYAWGEIEGFEPTGDPLTFTRAFTHDAYKWQAGDDGDGHPLFSKYNAEDSKVVLEAVDDAATNALGTGWRTPTVEEFQELYEGCNWEYKADYNGSGRNGWLATSKANGKTIFLPMVGNGNNNGNLLYNDNRRIYFRSSTLYPSSKALAHDFCGKPESIEYNDRHYRSYGLPILPIHE